MRSSSKHNSGGAAARPRCRGDSRISAWFLTAALALSGTVCVWLGWNGYRIHDLESTRRERQLRFEELRGEIVHFDEVLTMSARLAAATGDKQWEERYRQFEPKLDAAIKEVLRREADRSQIVRAAEQIDASNINLVEMEHRGLDLIRSGQTEQARAVLFNRQGDLRKSTRSRPSSASLRAKCGGL